MPDDRQTIPASGCSPPRAVLAAQDFVGKVIGITDGDTMRVMHDGAAEQVRLWGIDHPESKQPFGTRAKQFTTDLAFGHVVTVRVRDVDRNLNQELVRAGFTWWYRQFAKGGHVLAEFEEEPRAAKRGLWADPDSIVPREWVKQGAVAYSRQ